MLIRCGYADCSAGQLHYRQAGSGAPLLLLHPAPRSSRVFVPLLEQVDGFQAIAVDLPGFGASCPLPPRSTMEDIAALMVEFLDALGIEAAHVFGLHSGNKVAAALAAAWPTRVEHLIIAGMRHSIIPDAGQRNAAMRRYVANKLPLRRDDDPAAYDEEQVDKLACRAAYDDMYNANYSFDLAGALTGLAVQTLILELVTPQEDFLGSPAEELAALMTNARVEKICGNDRELLQRRSPELSRILLTLPGLDGVGRS